MSINQWLKRALWSCPERALYRGNRHRFSRRWAELSLIGVEACEDRCLLSSLSLQETTYFGGAGDQRGTDVEIQGSDIFVSGVGNETQSPSADAFLVKYSAPTNAATTPVFSNSWTLGTFNGIAVDGNDVYAAGFSHPGDGLTNDGTGGTEVKTLLSSFDSNNVPGAGPGSSNWASPVPQGTFNASPGTSFFSYNGVENYLDTIAVDDGLNTFVYAVGHAQPCSHTTFVVGKYDDAGNVLAGATAAAANFGVCSAPNTAKGNVFGVVELNGSIFTAGGIGDATGAGFPTVWKYDANLNVQWKNQDLSVSADFAGMTTDGTFIYAAGATRGDADYFIAKYDQAGNQLWKTVSGGIGTSDFLRDVEVIGGRIFATGYSDGPGAGGDDMVVLEIDPSTGAIISTDTFGGVNNDRGTRTATDGTDLYVVGESRSAAVGGNSVGENDAVLWRFGISSLDVTTTTDGGTGSLRQAVINANAAAGSDTITLPAGTYTLTLVGDSENASATGDLDITDDLTIIGAGADTTIIDASTLGDRVFEVFAGITLDLSGVTLTGGNAVSTNGSGGAIRNAGTLLVTDSTLDNNTSGNGSGGAIFNDQNSTTTIVGSTLSNNQTANAGGGGAIFNNSVGALLTVTNSTFSGNNAPASAGGAIYNNASGTLNLINSTLTANTAGNGVGGGIYIDPDHLGPTVNVTNSIVAQNSPNQIAGGGTLDVNVTNILSGNPLLGPLQNNGGTTSTHALLAGSPAIDTGTFAGSPATDQRGTARPQGAGVDIGAFELQAAPPNVVPDINSLTVDQTSILENATVTLDGVFTDADLGDEHTVTIDWGDGTIQVETLTVGARTFSIPHQYLDDGPAPGNGIGQHDYTISVVVNDDNGGISQIAPPAGSISRWRAEGNAIDDVGANNGTVQGGVTYVAGQTSQAFHFDGSSGRVDMGNPANLNFGTTGEFALEAWFNWDGGGSAVNNIIRKSNYPVSGPGAGYWLRINKSTQMLDFFAGETVGLGGFSRGSISTSVTPNVWHHAVGVRDNSGLMKLYLDGQLAGTVSAPNADTTSSAPFVLGAWDDRFGVIEFFSGAMDEVAVYDHALSEAEILSLFSGGTTTTTTVNNVAPQLANVAVTPTIFENDLATLSGAVVDPGTLDTFTLEVDWGDPLSPNDLQSFALAGVPLTKAVDGIDWNPVTREFSVDHQYLDDNPSGSSTGAYSIDVTVTDDDGGIGSLPTGAGGMELEFAIGIGSTGPTWEFTNDVITDAAGNIFVGGNFTGTVDFDPGPGTFQLTGAGLAEPFVAKYSSTGDFIWARELNSIGHVHPNSANSLALDSIGNLYVGGAFHGTMDSDPGPGVVNLSTSSSLGAGFLLKLDSAGDFVWSHQLTLHSPIQSVAVDAADHLLYAFSAHRGAVIDVDPGPAVVNVTAPPGTGPQRAFVVKVSSGGTLDWVQGAGGFGQGNVNSPYLSVDASGSIYSSGAFSSSVDFDPGAGAFNLVSAGGNDVYVWKLDSSGSLVWAKGMGGTSNDDGFDSVLDGAGNVYAVGKFEGTADFDPGPGTYNLNSAGSGDAFAVKLDSSGSLEWARSFGGSSYDALKGAAVNQAGQLFATGIFQQAVDFDPGAGVFNLTSGGGPDIAVWQLDTNGDFVDAVAAGGSGNDEGNTITVDANGEVIVGGYFNGLVDFDPTAGTSNLTSVGGNDALLWKLAAATTTPVVTVNNADPVAADQNYTTDEDAPLVLSVLAGTDDGGAFAIIDQGTLDTHTAVAGTFPTTQGGSVTIAANGSATYTPDSDFFGIDTFDYTALDDDTGSDLATVTITVNAVNDEPSFAAVDPPAVDQDLGPQTIAGWATFDPGPPNEVGQTATYIVDAIQVAGLFAAGPAIDANGTLTYTSAPGAFGTSTFDVKVIDSGGSTNGGDDTSDTQTFTITVNQTNQAPIANPDGPYSVAEGAAVNLDGSLSFDPDDGIQDYEWDLDYDGITFDVDSVGVAPLFDASTLDGPLSRDVALRVRDTLGEESVIVQTTVTVNNAAPSLTVTGPIAGVPGQKRNLTLTVTDPSVADESSNFTFRIDWDGDALIDETVVAPSGTIVPYVFPVAGVFDVGITAEDKDGGISLPITHMITISHVAMLGNRLVVGGTSLDDTIDFNDAGGGQVEVVLNGVNQGTYTPTTKIVAFGQAGNDTIRVDNTITLPARLLGNDGNDLLRGGGGDDTLVGGDGNDTLFGRNGDDTLRGNAGADDLNGGKDDDLLIGGADDDTLSGNAGNDTLEGRGGSDTLNGNNGDDSLDGGGGADILNGDGGDDILRGGGGADILNGGGGADILLGNNGQDTLNGNGGRDILIGGAGADDLFGGSGRDILIGGTTIYDDDDAVLAAIMAEWNSGGSYQQKVDNLKNGGGLNGTFTLQAGVSVLDDGAIDNLFGDNGRDWFFQSIDDVLADLAGNEITN